MEMERQTSPIDNSILSAPAEIKSRGLALNNSLSRFQKAQRQVELWNREMEIAAAQCQHDKLAWEEVFGRWDAEANIVRPNEKMELSL